MIRFWSWIAEHRPSSGIPTAHLAAVATENLEHPVAASTVREYAQTKAAMGLAQREGFCSAELWISSGSA
ncbi:MAG: hypothetical protein M3Y72_13145 [Acidobacteriota bacterium]|nr:hypothetical protein [Acidobacteriota bacterium]